MKRRLWFGLIGIFLAAAALAPYLLSRRAFLNDFNQGVYHYFKGQWDLSRASLEKALARRPQNANARRLLAKVHLEEGMELYRLKEYQRAFRSFARAVELSPQDPGAEKLLETLGMYLARPTEAPPVEVGLLLQQISQASGGAYPEREMEARLFQLIRQFQLDQKKVLESLAESQQATAGSLLEEQRNFRRILLGAALFLGAMALFLTAAFWLVYQRLFGQKGLVIELLALARRPAHGPENFLAQEAASQTALTSLDFRKIDVIEAELVNETDGATAHRLLQPFLEDEDPWMRARAAKVMYKVNKELALDELRRLADNKSKQVRLYGIWALGELATPETLDILAPSVWHPDKEIQKAAIQCLIKIENKKQAPKEALERVDAILSQLRSKTEWIF